MSPPRLWSWSLSPFAGKARVVAAEKGIELELIEIDPRRRPPRLRELNPTSRVPVLEVDGVGVRESTAICEWFDEIAPDPPLWPADPVARAAARGLLRWVDDELSVNYFLALRKQTFGLDAEDHPDLISILDGRLARRWPRLEELLGRTDGVWMMGGETPTLTDLAAMPLAVRLTEWRPELAPAADAHPRTAAWLQALRDRPSAAEVNRRGTRLDASPTEPPARA
jgi:glutathione S-transferase